MKQRKPVACMSLRLGTAVVAAMCFFPLLAAAQGGNGGREQMLFQFANRSRMEQGLRPLKWNDALANAASRHSLLMARQNTLSHQFPGELSLAERTSRAGAHFSSVAENIAEGPDVASIHEQWMKSPPHRRNLLDPQMDLVGVAVAEENGQLFAVEDFSQAVAALSPGDQEKLVVTQLQSRGLSVLSYTENARRTCAMDNGYTGNHTPSFVVHYFTTDLANLPGMLEQRIQSGRYHSAAVGACKPAGKTNFTQYRVAVMLFE